jgi:hypothetical protein
MMVEPPELPPAVARAFVEAMQAYFAETISIKRDQIVSAPPSGFRRLLVQRLRARRPPHSRVLPSG